jgi:peptidoglycan hydrolase-like protein with peptidoglycan-binding domain
MSVRSTIGVLLLLSSATAGAAFAQNSAQPAKPAAKPAPAMQQVKHDSSSMAAHKQTWTKDQIKTAQVGLSKAGLYTGDTTGVWNAATGKALKAYQKKNKLKVTGHLNDEVLAKLKG